MQKPLRNSVNMIRTTLSFCTNNPTPTAGIPAFALVKTTAGNKLVLIDSLNQIAEGTSIGVTLDTKVIRTTMTDIAFKCGSAVGAFAASTNNNTLRLKVSFTRSAMKEFAKDEIDDICQTIHDEANTNIALAAAFGYDATDVTDLQTAIDLYRTSVQNPRQSIISKGDAIKNIRLLVREIIGNLFLLQMDKMVDTLPLATQLNFINSYGLARETINLGSTKAKVRGTVRNKITAPLAGVTFIILKTGTSEIVGQTLSTENGSFGISPLLPGNYDLIWSLPGYQTITQTNVHISAGKELQRKITMIQTGNTIVREGDVPPLGLVNINVDGIKGISFTSLLIEITGSPLKFYAAVNTSDAPGTQFYQAAVGNAPFVPDEFAVATGFGPDKPFLNVQNTGAVAAHYKLTFSNLEP